MEKNVIIYAISVVLSVLIYYIILKRKCILLKNLQNKVQVEKQINENLIYMFYQIIGMDD